MGTPLLSRKAWVLNCSVERHVYSTSVLLYLFLFPPLSLSLKTILAFSIHLSIYLFLSLSLCCLQFILIYLFDSSFLFIILWAYFQIIFIHLRYEIESRVFLRRCFNVFFPCINCLSKLKNSLHFELSISYTKNSINTKCWCIFYFIFVTNNNH